MVEELPKFTKHTTETQEGEEKPKKKKVIKKGVLLGKEEVKRQVNVKLNPNKN